VDVIGMHPDLMVAAGEVELGEEACPLEFIQ